MRLMSLRFRQKLVDGDVAVGLKEACDGKVGIYDDETAAGHALVIQADLLVSADDV